MNKATIKHALLLLLLLCSGITSAVAQADKYQYYLDLSKVSDDRLQIELSTPAIKSGEIVFRVPKIVPGTYSIYDFGRFIKDFKAFDKNNQPLPVTSVDVNSWKIQNATSLAKITYSFDDTYDADPKDNYVFQPAGTSIEDKKVFALNPHTFLGYFDGMKRLPYEIKIRKPENFYGSTPLIPVSSDNQHDVFQAQSFMSITDSPIMYSLPDTTVMQMGGSQVLVSVYSADGQACSKEVAASLKQVLDALQQYLGGTLPVKKYAFIIYLTDKPPVNGAQGALEHSYSSMYFLVKGRAPIAQLAGTIRDVGAHEFYHIVTPLSIHSEEIDDFDYNNPAMSRHLWLYEGVTEYSSHYAQLRHGVITEEDFFKEMAGKITDSRTAYDDKLSFTEMSKNVLTKYEAQYGNVYQKGALIGLCLDIQLRHYSKGKYGLQDLMNDLSKRYGASKPFKDEELFAAITEMTYPQIGEFLNKYVAGNKPLPLEEVFAMIGVDFMPGEKYKEVTMGGIALRPNMEKGRVVVASTKKLDKFGKKMGFREGDEFISFNGQEVNLKNGQAVLGEFRKNARAGDKLEIVVIRKDKDGQEKQVKLKGKLKEVERQKPYVVKLKESATEEQLKIRQSWIKAS